MMNISLEIVDKKDPECWIEDGDEVAMELSPFQFCLEELSQFVDGRIFLNFGKEELSLDIFSDFAVCYEEIVESIILAKSKAFKKESIYFCEQGSDFYLNYSYQGDKIEIEYKKGEEVGLPNRSIDDFKVSVCSDMYFKEWYHLFEGISILFGEKLNKSIAIDMF